MQKYSISISFFYYDRAFIRMKIFIKIIGRILPHTEILFRITDGLKWVLEAAAHIVNVVV